MLNQKSLITIGILFFSGLNFCYSLRLVQPALVQPAGFSDPKAIFESCIERRTCQSNNDPHMVSFDNYNFEFQVDGSHCMAASDLYQVQAQFEPCNGAATCNCKVEIILQNGQFARINDCGTSTWVFGQMQTSTGSFTCTPVWNPMFNPFSESHWNMVSNGNTNFRCVQFNSYTYIKTVLPNPDDNVIVQVSAGMSSVYVIVPPSFTPVKECLCDVRDGSSVKYVNHIKQEEIKAFKNFENCENILKPEKLRDAIAKLDNAELNARLDNFVQNCAIDAEVNQRIDLGKFQKDDARADICQVVLNQSADQAADFLKLLGLTDDLIKRIQAGSENGFANCVKYIQNF